MRLLVGLGLSLYLAMGVLTQINAVAPDAGATLCLGPLVAFIASMVIMLRQTTRTSQVVARAAILSAILWLTFIPAMMIFNYQLWEPLAGRDPFLTLALATSATEIGAIMAVLSLIVFVLARRRSTQPLTT